MTWQLQDAKNRFSAVVEAAVRGQPQQVTRRGKPVVVVIGAEEYERFCRLAQSSPPSFNDVLLGMPQDDGTLIACWFGLGTSTCRRVPDRYGHAVRATATGTQPLDRAVDCGAAPDRPVLQHRHRGGDRARHLPGNSASIGPSPTRWRCGLTMSSRPTGAHPRPRHWRLHCSLRRGHRGGLGPPMQAVLCLGPPDHRGNRDGEAAVRRLAGHAFLSERIRIGDRGDVEFGAACKSAAAISLSYCSRRVNGESTGLPARAAWSMATMRPWGEMRDDSQFGALQAPLVVAVAGRVGIALDPGLVGASEVAVCPQQRIA